MNPQRQRRDALVIANSIRYAKADIKRAVRDLDQAGGMALVADLFDWEVDHGYPYDAVEAFKFGELVGAIPRFGIAKANTIARHVQIVSHERRVRALSNRQRTEIAYALRNPRLLWPTSRCRPGLRAAA